MHAATSRRLSILRNRSSHWSTSWTSKAGCCCSVTSWMAVRVPTRVMWQSQYSLRRRSSQPNCVHIIVERREGEREREGGVIVLTITGIVFVSYAGYWLYVPLVLWGSELAAFFLHCPRVADMSHDYHMICLTTPLPLKSVKRPCWRGRRSVPWCRPALWECASRNSSPRGGEDRHLHRERDERSNIPNLRLLGALVIDHYIVHTH